MRQDGEPLRGTGASHRCVAVDRTRTSHTEGRRLCAAELFGDETLLAEGNGLMVRRALPGRKPYAEIFCLDTQPNLRRRLLIFVTVKT